MKKILSIFAAILFAGSMMADTAVATLTKGSTNSYDDVTINEKSAIKMGKSGAGGNMTITVGAGATSLTFHAASWNADGAVTLDITAPTGVTVTPASITAPVNENLAGTGKSFTVSPESDYEFTVTLSGASAGATLTVATNGSGSKRAYVWDATYEWEAVTDPYISADDVDLGEVMYEPGGQFQTEISIDVNSANLTSDIDVSLPAVTNLSITAPATGTLEMNTAGAIIALLTATAGEIDDQIILTSGSTTKTIAITGTVFEKLYNPGTAAVITAGENAIGGDSTFVNNDAAVKVGTSSKAGTMKITVPATASKLYFYAAAWSGKACYITLSAPDGVTLTSSQIEEGKINLLADDGIAGNGPVWYTKKGNQALYQVVIDLAGLTAETEITITAPGTNKRFVVWNATYEGVSTAIENAEVAGQVQKVIENGQLFIIKNGVKYNAQGAVVR